MLSPEHIILLAPPFLLAITVHEFSHGYVAYRLGDPTARDMGRLTFNPIAHIDLFGLIALVIIGFGWAKPVPVNPNNLADPRRDNLWISLAGPASNFISAFLFGLLFRILHPILPNSGISTIILGMVFFGVWINLILTIFNLLPIPPLDGFHILEGLVSTDTYIALQSFRRIGPMILLGLIVISSFTGAGVFRMIFNPFLMVFGSLFTGQSLAF